MIKILAPIAVILIAIVGVLAFLKQRADDSRIDSGGPAVALDVGATVPDFPIKRLADGKSMHLSEILTGQNKVVMVNFWATWCEACMVEMPSIVRLQKQFKDKGFDVVAINLDEDPQDVVPETAKKLGMGFPVYLDNADQEIATLFDVHAIPLTVMLDKNRKILFIEPGEREWDGAEEKAQLEKWLAKS